jgi:hypothetical protein
MFHSCHACQLCPRRTTIQGAAASLLSAAQQAQLALLRDYDAALQQLRSLDSNGELRADFPDQEFSFASLLPPAGTQGATITSDAALRTPFGNLSFADMTLQVRHVVGMLVTASNGK